MSPMIAIPVEIPAELPAAWTDLQNKSSDIDWEVETPKDPTARQGIEYKYTTLRPSGNQQSNFDFWARLWTTHRKPHK